MSAGGCGINYSGSQPYKYSCLDGCSSAHIISHPVRYSADSGRRAHPHAHPVAKRAGDGDCFPAAHANSDSSAFGITNTYSGPRGLPFSYPATIVPGPSVPNRPHDDDLVFRSLTIHPLNPDIVFLGTERNGFIWSRNGGATWSRYRAGLRSNESGYSEIWDIDFSAINPDIIMATTLDSPGRSAGPEVNAGLYRSTDGGQTWTQLNCGIASSRVVSIRIDSSNPYVSVAGLGGGWPSFTAPGDDQYYPGGIYRTGDGGQNWSRVTVQPNDERNGYVIMRMTRGSQPQIVTFGMNRDDSSENLGFMRSNHIGRTWEFFAPEFRTKSIEDFDLSADGQSIYAHEGAPISGGSPEKPARPGAQIRS